MITLFHRPKTRFAMFAQSPMLPKSPLIEEYVKRVVSRPAFQRAAAKDSEG